MEGIETFEIEPIDEIKIFDVLGDYAGTEGSVIKDKNGKSILIPYGNYDLFDLKNSLSGAHAFCNYIKITKGKESHYLIFDTGQNGSALEHNTKVLSSLDKDFDPKRTEMLLLSHGHTDHYGNLNKALEIINPDAKREVPLYISGETFWNPRAKIPKESNIETKDYIIYKPDKKQAEERGGKWISSYHPKLLIDNMVLYLGSIRPEAKKIGVAKDYEMKPRPWPKIYTCDNNGNAVSEDHAEEDTSIAFNVKDKGLVVITGCSHAGVNTSLNYARTISGTDKVYCYYGGFHPNTDPEATAKDLLEQNIRYLIPTHCSPSRLINFLWQENNKSEKGFMLTKNHLAPVGHTYIFSSNYQDS
ncbi:MAG TPA: MBL fold metallo-hydrolase [Nitrospinota bacterium]|nr:MBL fold metallo-hydrolase [Nitrospinota bacterium]